MNIPIEPTATYPTRYEAFDRNAILCVHDKPKMSGGHEWAVFCDTLNHVYGSIVSYQDQGLLIEVCKGKAAWGSWIVTYSERYPYNYEQAQRKLIEELEKVL